MIIPPLISILSAVAYLCLFLTSILYSSLAADTLSANQILSGNQTLTSQNQVFQLGFFSPGKSKREYIGIWYRETPDIVVWVANRDDPVNDSARGDFRLGENGVLYVNSSEGTVIWSSNFSGVVANPVLKLLDTGNLVVSEESSLAGYVWQSFDYLGNTRLPGMKMVHRDLDPGSDRYLTSWKSADDPSAGDFVYRIDNKGLPQMTIFMGAEKRYRSGPWNGVYFTGLPFFSAPAFTTEIFFSEGGVISISERYNSSLVTRFTMNYTGHAQRFIKGEENESWDLVFEAPSDTCDNYGQCGPNGVCKIYQIPTCDCLKGFKPKSQAEWDRLEWSSGCAREVTRDCPTEDGFLKFDRIKFPDLLSYRAEANVSGGECHNECLKNCSCSAYADPFMSNGTPGCLMWFGDLIDVRELFGGVTYPPSIYIRVPISEVENATDGNEKRRRRPENRLALAIASAVGVLLLGLLFGVLVFRRRFKRQASKRKEEYLELPLFNWATIASATNNFSWENMIGEGGFGPVYKGNLSTGQAVAVKKMSRTSGQGPDEFRNEVILISKLQHRNLVRILGCSIRGEEKIIIYEYMENKSLDNFIFDQDRRSLLSWPKRFEIAMGIARGLLYLHHDSRLKVIHRDLKTSNILLDENLNAKISDFGLARMFERDQTTARTRRVAGTYGYMAPEYALNGKYSIKSDVFSLGVVLLEIVSGQKNRGSYHADNYQSLLGQAWLLWYENRELELMDECYMSTCVESQVKRCIQVGLLCVQRVEEDRPDMPSVLNMLSSEDSSRALPPPKEPGCFMETDFWSNKRSTSESAGYLSGKSVTMSDLSAR